MISRLTTGPTWTPCTFVRRWDGAAWVNVSFVKRWDGSAWVQLWPAASSLEAAANKSSVEGLYNCTYNNIGVNTCPVMYSLTSESVTVSSTGGSGAGPTYAWTYLSGDTGITVSNSTAATVTFAGAVSRRQTRTAVWRCTVTRGTDSRVVDIPITLTYDYFRDGEVIP